MPLQWNGNAFDKAVRRHMGNNLDVAGGYFRDSIKDELGIDVGRDSNGMVILRSMPFEYPRKETGDLQESFRAQVSRPYLRTRVGSDDEAAIFLEEGTIHMEPRPMILRTLLVERDAIGARMCAPLK